MHKTFISFHHENEQDLKDEIIERFGGEYFINKSVGDEDIDIELCDDSIMAKIRQDHIADSTVTLILIGKETYNRPFINSEIQASLWGDNPSGLLGVIRDEVYDEIFDNSVCLHPECRCGIATRRKLSGYAVLLPYLVKENHKCSTFNFHYSDDDVYCSLIKYSNFLNNCEKYINQAFNKRGKLKILAKKNPDHIPCIRRKTDF